VRRKKMARKGKRKAKKKKGKKKEKKKGKPIPFVTTEHKILIAKEEDFEIKCDIGSNPTVSITHAGVTIK
jgi:hypothetical protein